MKSGRRGNVAISQTEEAVQKKRYRELGFRNGWSKGYHLGRCEALRRCIRSEPQAQFNCRVLFIPQGFDALDQGVREGLEALAKELIVGDAVYMASQAEQQNPDLVLVMNGLHVFPEDHLEQVAYIRRLGIPTVIWFADDPYFMDESIRVALSYDYVFTHEQASVDFYRSQGCTKVYHLPLAVSLELYRPMAVDDKYSSDICFVGNAFSNRIAFIDEVADYLLTKKIYLIGALWDQLKHFRKFESSIHLGWMPVEETVRYYNGAKLVLNLYRSTLNGDHNKNTVGLQGVSVNPRTFEIAACGVCQITDFRPELPSLYIPGIEIASFTSPGQFITLCEYYLEREEERLSLAVGGFRRTLEQHTFPNRLRGLLELVISEGRVATVRKGGTANESPVSLR
ncbi:hypothetical protein B7C51_06205 [Paenibacillus larvae subsp. pulvifaciens]|uniref:Spore protein YkvP/CgeB glycosyl transferase-like domain-containing protein n=1 Tax=Paenibacillus larvae subsp. pulvifaciens TaxID=1477 RepID=A0A1V0UQD2_9BACL|nr:DUF3880 domain-containing protein [Paenibacillus larvae]ARF67495.1 hypothetical protein B7C51_06205 [Paenibacillus larvae subsp. pulvifaciens]